MWDLSCWKTTTKGDTQINALGEWVKIIAIEEVSSISYEEDIGKDTTSKTLTN